MHAPLLRVNPDKQLSQLPEGEQERQPVVEFVVPHWKHCPVIVCEYPKEQDKQINDLLLY